MSNTVAIVFHQHSLIMYAMECLFALIAFFAFMSMFSAPATAATERKYTKPKMIQEIPALEKYCYSPDNEYAQYHCRELETVLFRAANYQEHYKNYYFQKITTDGCVNPTCNEISDMQWYISYHVKHLMEKEESPEVAIETCHQFEDLCYKYLGISFMQSNTKTQPEDIEVPI